MSLAPHGYVPTPNGPPPGVFTLAAPPDLARQSFRRTLIRRRWSAYIAFVLVALAVLVATPFFPRSYRAAGGFTIFEHNALDPATHQPLINLQPLINQSPRRLKALIENNPFAPIAPADIAIRQTPVDRAGQTRFKLVGTFRNPTVLSHAINSAIGAWKTIVARSAEQLIAKTRARLKKRAKKQAVLVHALRKQKHKFESAHPDVSADVPGGIAGQYDKLRDAVATDQSNLIVANSLLKRYAALRAKIKRNGAAPPPKNASPAAIQKLMVRRDPQVAQLEAQLQLVENQIQYQLTTMHRTNQHPYVRQLRRKERALSRRLRAAKQRAAQGKPPPRQLIPPADTSANPAIDILDLKIQKVEVQRDQAAIGLKMDQSRLAVLRPRMQMLLPQRRALASITRLLRRARGGQRRRDDRLRQFRQAEQSAAGLGVSVGAIREADASTLPAWPAYPWMVAAALLAGVVAGALTAAARQALDRSFQTPEQFAAIAGVPALGTIDQIETAAQRRGRRIAAMVIQPLALAAGLLLLVAGAWWSHNSLHDANFHANRHKLFTQRNARPDTLRAVREMRRGKA